MLTELRQKSQVTIPKDIIIKGACDLFLCSVTK